MTRKKGNRLSTRKTCIWTTREQYKLEESLALIYYVV